MNMPVYERRFFLGLLTKEFEKREEETNESSNTISSSKGSRKTRISGDALKSKIKNGEIPLA